MLEPVLRDRILQRRDDLSERGALLNAEQLSACYATFREQFGPERLQALSGERLLTAMHAHGSQDSLVYWLEFKNDEALPAAFGSIGGGSALKFGIYRSLETGEWRTGSSRNQRTLSVLEAIAVAERHRDELVAVGVVILTTASLIDASSSDGSHNGEDSSGASHDHAADQPSRSGGASGTAFDHALSGVAPSKSRANSQASCTGTDTVTASGVASAQRR